MAVIAGEFLAGLYVPCRSSHTYLTEIDIGITGMIHVFAHGGFIIQHPACLGLVKMVLDLLLRRGRKFAELLFTKAQIKQGVELPHLRALGDKLAGKHPESMDRAVIKIGRYYNHGLSVKLLAQTK